MTRRRFATVERDPSAVLGRAVLLTVIAVGGAVAACVMVDYFTRERAERVGVGTGIGPAASVDEWLRQTAARLKRGSHALMASVDPASREPS
jgi:hypothetical protein